MKRLVLAVAALAVALAVVIMVAWWFLPGPWMVLRPPTSESQPMRNGVAAIVVCGGDSDFETGYEAAEYAPRPKTGVWAPQHKGDCTVWFHLQPGE